MYRMLPELRAPKILHVLSDLLVRVANEYHRWYNSDYASGHYVYVGKLAVLRGCGCRVTNVPSVEIVFGP